MVPLVWERAQRLLHHSPCSNAATISLGVGIGGMTFTSCPQPLPIYTPFINASEGQLLFSSGRAWLPSGSPQVSAAPMQAIRRTFLPQQTSCLWIQPLPQKTSPDMAFLYKSNLTPSPKIALPGSMAWLSLLRCHQALFHQGHQGRWVVERTGMVHTLPL